MIFFLYLLKGFGKRLMPHSARRSHDWILSHDPLPVHPDRSVSRRDYRGLPPFDKSLVSSSTLTSAPKKPSGSWMTSCDNDWEQSIQQEPTRLIYRDDCKRIPIYPWHF